MAAGPERTRDPRVSEILSEPRPRRNAARLVFLCLLLMILGGWLRSREIASRPLWLDEASFWKSSQVSLMDKLEWRHHFEHPPLAYIVEGWSFRLLGDRPEWLVRLPSFLFGLSCIPLAFLLGRTIGGDTMGLWAAALATIDPVMVEQARQARMYSQFEALLLLTLTVAIRLARARPAARLPWILLGLLEGSLYWTSQAALAAWVGQLLGTWWLGRGGRARREHDTAEANVAGQGGTGWRWTWITASILALPGFYRLAYRLLHPILNRSDPTDAARLTADMVSTVRGLTGGWGILLLPLALWGLWKLWREKPIAGVILSWIAIVNLAGLIVLRTLHPLLNSRYLVALFPSIWVGAAAFVVLGAASTSRARHALLALAIVGVVAGLVHVDPWPPFLVGEEIRALPRVVRPGDAIVYLPRYTDFIGSYYGVPRSPELSPGESTPRPESLDGRRVWLVSGLLPAERFVREARDLIAELARRRGADSAAVLAPVRLHYTGVIRFETTGSATAWHLVGGRLEPDSTR